MTSDYFDLERFLYFYDFLKYMADCMDGRSNLEHTISEKSSDKDFPILTGITVLDDGSGRSYDVSEEELREYAHTGDASKIKSRLPPGTRLVLPYRPSRNP